MTLELLALSEVFKTLAVVAVRASFGTPLGLLEEDRLVRCFLGAGSGVALRGNSCSHIIALLSP